jgi:excisionase family DNA binding protein
MSERLLTARELGEFLGLSPSTVLDWHEAGRIPSFKLGGRAVRFRESEILAWLEESRRGPAPCSGPLEVVRSVPW